MDGAPVDQEGRAAVLPPEGQRSHQAPVTWAFTTRCRPSLPTCPDENGGHWRARGAARRGPPWQLHRQGRDPDALVREHRRRVGEGTMVDTWATVGLLRADRAGVHLSGGVGIGRGVLAAAGQPTIIGNNCFIGARSEIVRRRDGGGKPVLSMGVYMGPEHLIYDRATGEISYGRVPAGSVVISGNPPKDGGTFTACAAIIIVKKVDAQTRAKTSLNDLLRDCTAHPAA